MSTFNDQFPPWQSIQLRKSRLAIPHAHHFLEAKPLSFVLRIHASVPFEEAYTGLADRLELSGRDHHIANALELVSNWLCDESDGKWRMIVETVDDVRIAESREACLSQSCNGSILLTSEQEKGRWISGPGLPGYCHSCAFSVHAVFLNRSPSVVVEPKHDCAIGALMETLPRAPMRTPMRADEDSDENSDGRSDELSDEDVYDDSDENFYEIYDRTFCEDLTVVTKYSFTAKMAEDAILRQRKQEYFELMAL
ncbi:hypothetical protein K490DRAFT_60125 [Saccharata proteae CBS 121410]|uniref:Uncharacterized protein n=1 Tax=Saccharata proteae CBS 121410 TaxID=1314787 RepID=A0A9P4HLL8_9PEZI|nr:hypothetical protein K490DRAFT_60125 [Saccharata proteae CBS 121410]